MSDPIKRPTTAIDTASSTRTLTRIAQALGFPASRFTEGEGRASASTDEAVALLALVRAYLQDADPGARTLFAEAVAAMARDGEAP